MQELMILIAKETPEDALLDLLEKELKSYRQDKTKEKRNSLTSILMLTGMRYSTDGESTLDVIKEAQKAKGLAKLLNENHN